MIKMKRLIRSLVIASGGLFLAATASNAASISFAPKGTQLDSDPILDIETSPGQVIDFEVLFDTNGITTNLLFSVEINFSIELDPTELQLVSFPEGLIGTAPNSFSIKRDGIPQKATGSLTTFQVKVLNGLINDGMSDLRLTFNSANIGGDSSISEDVSSSFGGSGAAQTVEVQPVPEPTTIFGSALALGVGGWLKRKKSSQHNKTTP
jgi:hypothetical protein